MQNSTIKFRYNPHYSYSVSLWAIAGLIFVAIISLFFSRDAAAYEKDFPPYAKGKFPPNCEIHSLKALSESPRDKGNFKSVYQLEARQTIPHKKLLLELVMHYQKDKSGLYLTLKNSNGKTYIKSLKVGSHPANIKKLYWAYLNKDSLKDLIVTLDEGDGYLSAGRQLSTFLLSTRQAYTAKQLDVFNLQPEDFYDYSADNKCEFLHQARVSTGQQEYWVYNVLQFIDHRIVLKNQLSRYFPKWIALTAAANNKAATLGSKQKAILQKDFHRQHRKNIEK